jgi:hypothetical protein
MEPEKCISPQPKVGALSESAEDAEKSLSCWLHLCVLCGEHSLKWYHGKF